MYTLSTENLFLSDYRICVNQTIVQNMILQALQTESRHGVKFVVTGSDYQWRKGWYQANPRLLVYVNETEKKSQSFHVYVLWNHSVWQHGTVAQIITPRAGLILAQNPNLDNIIPADVPASKSFGQSTSTAIITCYACFLKRRFGYQ